MANDIKPAIDVFVKEIDRAERAVKEFTDKSDKEIADFSKSARKNFENIFAVKTPADVNNRLEESERLIKELTATIKKQEKAIEALRKARQSNRKELTEEERLQRKVLASTRALNTAKSKESAEIQRNRTEANRLNREKRQESILNNKLIGAYQKLNLRRTQASRRLRDLVASGNASNKEIRRAQREFDRLDKRVQKANRAVRDFTPNVGNYTSALKGARLVTLRFAAALGFSGVLFSIAMGFREAIQTIREFDEQLIAVGKTTGLQGEELQNLANQTIALGLELKGISITGLLETAEVAGQLGIKGTESILAFSEAVEKLRITSDVASEETIRDFAKFIEVSSDTAENADRLGSVITRLGNNFATTETAIISNATEIQKGIAVFNTSAESVLGLGAATNALGSEAEASRTAIQKTFIVIEKAINTGEGLQDILRLTGLTQKELSEQFNRDATGVFVKFIKGLSDINKTGGSVTQQLDKLQLSNVRVNTVVGALSKNYDVLNSAVSQANQEYIDNTAANEEVEAATKSLNSIIGDLSDSWDAFILSIDKGDGVISNFLRTSAQGLTDFVNGLIKLNTTATQQGINAANRIVNAFKDNQQATAEETINFIKRTISEAEDNIDILESRVERANKRAASLGIIARPQVKKANADLQKEIAIRDQLLAILRKEEDAKSSLNQQTEQNTKDLNENTEAENKNTKEKKRNIEATAGSITALKKQISNLKELRDKTALTNEEFKDFNERIRVLERLIAVIDGTTEAFDEFNGEGVETTKIINDLVQGWDEYAGLKNEERLDRERKRMEALQQATEDFLNTFTTGFFAGAGMESLSMFFDGTFQSLIDGADTVKEKFAVTFNAIAEVAQEAFGFIEQLQAARFARQSQRLEEEREFAIQNANGQTEAIAQINADFDVKQRELKKKQAESDKRNAIFNIAINTAQGVIAALASVPPNVPLSIAIGAIGAIQAGVVSATPIPQFATGVENSRYQGPALMGEIRPEVLHRKRTGELHAINKPTIGHIERGDTVYKSFDNFEKNFFQYGDIGRAAVMMSLENQGNSLKTPVIAKKDGISTKEMDSIFARNMKKMTVLNLNVDQNGFGLSVQRGLSKTNIHKNRINFKGQKV